MPASDCQNLRAIDLAGETAVPVRQRAGTGQVEFHGGIAGQAGKAGQHPSLRLAHRGLQRQPVILRSIDEVCRGPGILLVAVGDLKCQACLIAMGVDGAGGGKRKGLAEYGFGKGDVGNRQLFHLDGDGQREGLAVIRCLRGQWFAGQCDAPGGNIAGMEGATDERGGRPVHRQIGDGGVGAVAITDGYRVNPQAAVENTGRRRQRNRPLLIGSERGNRAGNQPSAHGQKPDQHDQENHQRQ